MRLLLVASILLLLASRSLAAARIRRATPAAAAGAASCLNISTRTSRVRSLSVYYYSGEGYYLRDGCVDPGATAYGYFATGLNVTGWDTLEVTASAIAAETENDSDYAEKNRAAMFAAGLLEGLLTADRIEAHFDNLADYLIPKRDNLTERLRGWLSRQAAWARNFSDSNPDDPLARNIGYLLDQLQGLITGFSLAATVGYDPDFVMQLTNAAADSADVLDVLSQSWPDWRSMSDREFAGFTARRGHCTAVIRLLAGLEDLLAAHNTWNTYSATLRSFKHYNFRLLNDTSFVGSRQSFSGYPGTLASLDAFYVVNDRLVLLQTTNSVFNQSLFSSVTPHSLLAWQRVRAANQLATGGPHWAEQFARHNSGTYNNQYMLLDLARFQPGVALNNGALTIVEQIPGLVRHSDQTGILRAGYWPSYNVPFHADIYRLSGYPEIVARFGPDYSYQTAPRAKILRRDAVNEAGSAAELGWLMRTNRFATDPYSEGDPCKCLCCRGDLLAKNRAAFGCYDAKVTSSRLLRQSGAVWTVSGPTRDDGRLGPFSWAGFGTPISHRLLPALYNFTWVPMRPAMP